MQTPTFTAVILRRFNPVRRSTKSGRIGEAPQGEPLQPAAPADEGGGRQPAAACHRGRRLPRRPTGPACGDYVHVCDIAQGHVAALEALERRPLGVLTCNLGAGRPVSVRELIDTFERATGVSVPLQGGAAPRRGIWLGRPAGLDACTRARQELGWSPLRTMEEACRDAWNWQSQNPFGYDGPVL